MGNVGEPYLDRFGDYRTNELALRGINKTLSYGDTNDSVWAPFSSWTADIGQTARIGFNIFVHGDCPAYFRNDGMRGSTIDQPYDDIRAGKFGNGVLDAFGGWLCWRLDVRSLFYGQAAQAHSGSWWLIARPRWQETDRTTVDVKHVEDIKLELDLRCGGWQDTSSGVNNKFDPSARIMTILWSHTLLGEATVRSRRLVILPIPEQVPSQKLLVGREGLRHLGMYILTA